MYVSSNKHGFKLQLWGYLPLSLSEHELMLKENNSMGPTPEPTKWGWSPKERKQERRWPTMPTSISGSITPTIKLVLHSQGLAGDGKWKEWNGYLNSVEFIKGKSCFRVYNIQNITQT